MKLVSLTLSNFRCFRDETRIAFDDLTAIIGENDVGKSSALEALEVFFNSDVVKIENGDLSVTAEDNIVTITCEFTDLPQLLVLDAQAETSLGEEYLLASNGHLCIRKTYNLSSARAKEEVSVLAQHPTADKYADLLQLNNTALKRRFKELQIDEGTASLNNNPSMRHAIWQSCEDLQLDRVQVPVAKEDGKRIWDKLGEHLPLFALFQSDRSSRDSDSEVQDPMKLAIATALAEPDIQNKLSEVVEAVRSKAVDLANRTHETLVKIAPHIARELTPEFKADPKWPGLFSLALNSDQGIPMNKRGSGVRRMILVSFFRAEAERRLQDGQVRNIVYALEEPETSQHPNNQRILLESFQDLSSEPGCQVLLTTHSPGFAAYLPMACFRFMRRDATGKRNIVAGPDSSWEDIAETLGVIPDNRVQVLVCVEGPTDVKAMGWLSNALHLADQTLPDLSSDPRIAFIPLGGGTLKHWVSQGYLRPFGRPEVHIYDGDTTAYGAQVDLVNERTDGSWAVQTKKREIENYLHWQAVKDGIGVELDFGDDDDVPKLISQTLAKEPTGRQWNSKTVKGKLADHAFPKMTAALIEQRDSEGEVEKWMRRVGDMLE